MLLGEKFFAVFNELWSGIGKFPSEEFAAIVEQQLFLTFLRE